MSVSVIDGMFKTLEIAISEQVAGNFQKLYEIVWPIWSGFVLIYFIIIVFEIIYSDKQVIISEFFKHMMVLSLVSVFMGAGTVYVTDIVPMVMNSGSEVAGYIVGGNNESTGTLIDKMIDTVIEIGNKEYQAVKDSGIFDKVGAAIIYALKITVLAIFSGAFILYATAYLIIAMVMVGILLSLGGVFIAFAAFPATRQMFTAWVGSCFNYIFLNIGYAILFTILIKYLNKFVSENEMGNDPNNFWYIAIIALVFAVGVFLLQQVATLMSILTGGVGINGLTGAIGGAIRGTAGGALRGAGGAGRWAFGNRPEKGPMMGSRAGNAARAAANMLRTSTGKGQIKGG
ncbi:type IV secretion system protein [Morganella morganii subsp. sibonii]